MVPYIEDGVELQKAAAEAGKKNVFSSEIPSGWDTVRR